MPASASAGYTGIATESVPGGSGTPNTFVSPTQWLKLETMGVKTQPVVYNHNVYRNDRNTEGSPRLGKKRHGGPLGYALYPHNGQLLVPAALGTDALLAAVVGDVAASNTTLGGLTTWTLTTGTGVWKKGAMAIVSSDAGDEPLAVVSYSGSSTKHLVTSVAKLAHTGTITVSQPATHYSHRTTGANRKTLRTVSAQIDTADLYAYNYSGGMIDEWQLSGSATKVDVTSNIKFRSRVRNASPTAFDESDATLEDLAFEVCDGFAVFADDSTSSSAATVQRGDLGQDWSCSVKNNLKEETCLNRSSDFIYYPQNRAVDLKFKYLQEADRPVGWEYLMIPDIDTSFQAIYAYKQNSTWYGVTFRFPTIRYIDDNEGQTLNETAYEEISAHVRVANGEHDFEVFIANGDTQPY